MTKIKTHSGETLTISELISLLEANGFATGVTTGTFASLIAANSIPASGEVVYCTDRQFAKIGDGSTAFNSLPLAWSAGPRLLTTIDVSAMGNTEEIDVRGVNRISLVTFDAVLDGAQGAFVRCRRAGQGAADAGATDYLNGVAGNIAQSAEVTIEGIANVNTLFQTHISGLAVSAPTTVHSNDMLVGSSTQKERWGVHRFAEVVEYVSLYWGGGANGVSGSVYVFAN